MSDLDRIMMDKVNGLDSQDNDQPDDLYNRVIDESPKGDITTRTNIPVNTAVDCFADMASKYNKGSFDSEAAATQMMRSLGNLSAEELELVGDKLEKQDPNWDVTQSVNAQKEQVNTFKYTYPDPEIGINPVSFIGGTVGYAAHKAKNLMVGPDLQFSLAGRKLDVNTTDFGRVLGGEYFKTHAESYKKFAPTEDFKRNFYAK